MAEPRDDEPEGWGVPFRIGLLSALAVPIGLGIAVFAGGVIYDHTLRHQVQFSVTPQPAPGLEVAIHAGVRDPAVVPPPQPVDRVIERAKSETAAEGLAGWPGSGR